MSLASWYFKPHTPGATIREPIAGAFFANDAVSAPGEALIREGIQNSLDATPRGEKTSVRISLVSENEALDWNEARLYFTDASVHYRASDNGLRQEDLPREYEGLTVLVFEDFGTSGLQGDPTTPYPLKDTRENNFFHFFRAEGMTDKDTGKRGSWGLGKDTFFRASRVNTIFGLTVRKDDGQHLLMGKTILKSHYVGDNYCQDGYFGVRPNGDGHMVMPIDDSEAIQRFQKAFRLERRNDPGLSVIVPWFDPEITEKTLIQAVFQNYAYAILSGDLDVLVETSGIKTWIDRKNLLCEAQQFLKESDALPVIELAEWAMRDNADADRYVLNMPDPTRGWSWVRNLFTDDLIKDLGVKIKNEERIAIRVPVTVRKKNGMRKESYFDVYMMSEASNQRARPAFIRDGILVSDVRAPFMRDMRALVIIKDAPLSEFLREAENPSHTVWQEQQVKQSYVSGVGDLRFVVQSVKKICDLVMAEDKEEDRRLLSDLFPIRGEDGNNDKKGDNYSVPPPPPPPPQSKFFTIKPANGGFSVMPGTKSVENNSYFEIYMAYDVRRGNALKQYRNTDFQIGQSIQYQCEGLKVEEENSNRIVVRIVEPDRFRLTVTGFDLNRQIYVGVW